MSFQSLISGSECAVAANPLSQVLKHAEGDRSLQQDRIAGPSSSRLHHLPAASSAVVSEHDAALARQFFDGPRQTPTMGPAPPFIHAELSRMQMHPRAPTEATEMWTLEQQKPVERNVSDWTSEFGKSSSPVSGVVHNSVATRPEFQQRPSYMDPNSLYANSPMRMYGPSMGLNMFAGSQVHGLGKGKAKEADFEAAFAQAAAGVVSTGTARIEELDVAIQDVGDALENTKLDGQEELGTEFKKVWDHLQNSDLPPPKEDIAKWEAEFNQLMTNQRDDLDYGTTTQQAWEKGLGEIESFDHSSMSRFDEEGIPLLGDYVFDPDNKYLGPGSSSRSPLAEAKHLLDNNGSLSEAALLLEAAIQKGELGEGGYETWLLLGETRSMDEREDAGIRALREGVKLAEAAGGAGAGMLSLAISYTNESYDRGAHTMLLRWIQARYPNHPIPEATLNAMRTHSTWDTQSRITDVYISLARAQHAAGDLDPDVQIGLGVLSYTNGEYDRAKDCFESALAVRPRDYLLWNRLGSCLSNNNKPEEALGAYREALQLRPTYTRAIYNVGVACLNIGAYKEAAEHFLSALSLQESDSQKTSDQLWFTLRRAFQFLDRNDLAILAKPETKNLDTFRNEGFDF